MGCPDWPLCHGQLIPPLDDTKAWIEWIHRTVAAVIGFEILGLALLAWRRPPRPPVDPVADRSPPSLLVGFQAWLGRETVRLNNSGESVTAHLAAAMALLGLLVFILVRSLLPGAGSPAAAPASGSRCSRRSRAVAMFALLLFGSHVTATVAVVRVPGLAADERQRSSRRSTDANYAPTSSTAGWRWSSG